MASPKSSISKYLALFPNNLSHFCAKSLKDGLSLGSSAQQHSRIEYLNEIFIILKFYQQFSRTNKLN